MTAQKYPNKRKRKGYWKIYDRARIKDFRKIWEFSLEIVEEHGCPFVKKDNRGRKPKFPRHCYAAFCIVMVYLDMSLREMEGEIPLLTNDTLDHSVIDWWFEKLDDEWVLKTVRKLGDKIEAMFKKGEYIVDSTEYTTTRYRGDTLCWRKGTGTSYDEVTHSCVLLHNSRNNLYKERLSITW